MDSSDPLPLQDLQANHRPGGEGHRFQRSIEVEEQRLLPLRLYNAKSKDISTQGVEIGAPIVEAQSKSSNAMINSSNVVR